MHILLDWRRIVDFLVLVGSFYLVLRWAAGARALRIALAITALYAGVLFARQLDLVITTWILQGAALIAVAFLIVVFQPEVRRALMRLDRSMLMFRRLGTADPGQALSESAFEMASTRTGALFVVTRQDPIDELVDAGVVLGADISKPLIHAIFEKNSPLHDGAVIIEGGRIARAGVVLPLTGREDVPVEYGTRHRAAMGLAERTDALCLVVSEERGEVTVMRGRTFLRVGSPAELSRLLERPSSRKQTGLKTRARDFFVVRWRMKLAAVGLASLIWTGAMFDSSSSVRLLEVPIEFQNVPRGLDITNQSVTSVEVQLRGRRWLMDSNRISGVVARFDLHDSTEGRRIVHVVPGALNLPPGINVERVTPDTVAVRLIRRTPPLQR
jgi:diadenylate cyclase